MAPKEIPVGTRFVRVGAPADRVETVVDIHETRNLAGEVVKVEYVAEHAMMGQPVRAKHNATTVKRGMARLAELRGE